MIYILLGLILLLYVVRRSNTSDLYKLANITTNEQIKNYDDSILVIKSTKFSCLLLLCALISLITITLIRHTKIELFFMNYFGTEIYRDDISINFAWYALPFFIIIIRGIIIEVNIGDYLKKNYNLTEEEISAKEAVKGLKSATGYVRREVGKRLHLRKTPELVFIADDSIEHGMNIVKIMEDLRTEEE
jgi:hypothetical protein